MAHHDPEALARVRWQAEDTLDPVVRLAAQPRIAAAFSISERDARELAEIDRLTERIRMARRESTRARLRKERHRIYSRRWQRSADARDDRRDWIAANLETVRRSKREWARRARTRRAA